MCCVSKNCNTVANLSAPNEPSYRFDLCAHLCSFHDTQSTLETTVISMQQYHPPLSPCILQYNALCPTKKGRWPSGWLHLQKKKILEQKKTFFPLLLPSKYVVCMSIYNVYSKSQKKNLSQKLSFLSIKIIQAIWKFVKLGTAWEIFICNLHNCTGELKSFLRLTLQH